MKKYASAKVIFICASALVFPAWGQEPPAAPAPAANVTPVAAPPAPAAAAAPAAQPVALPSVPPGAFPQLPPARPCKSGDLRGIWRWREVYEYPVGNVTAEFKSSPNQYSTFGANNNRYVDYRSEVAQANGDVLKAVQRDRGTSQYVFDQGGFVFLYKDSKLIDTMACFIVTNPAGTFVRGQMLLMPPAREGMTGRMVKVYEKLHFKKPKPKSHPKPKKKGK